MHDHSPQVRGLTLNDYFRLKGTQDEDSGELVTKPRGYRSIDTAKIDEKEEDGDSDTQEPVVTEQFEEPLPNKQHQNHSPRGSPVFKTGRLSKLSSLELRSSSNKIYKNQKMRIRQVSNSPYQKDVSKPKQSFMTVNSNQMISTQYQFLCGVAKNCPSDDHPRRVVSPSPGHGEKAVNLRQIKQLRQLERNDEARHKNKLEGLFNTMNTYTKKLRDTQRSNKYRI